MSDEKILSISNKRYLNDLKRINDKSVILYPVSHTSIDNYNIHLDQLKFIKALIPSLEKIIILCSLSLSPPVLRVIITAYLA